MLLVRSLILFYAKHLMQDASKLKEVHVDRKYQLINSRNMRYLKNNDVNTPKNDTSTNTNLTFSVPHVYYRFKNLYT